MAKSINLKETFNFTNQSIKKFVEIYSDYIKNGQNIAQGRTLEKFINSIEDPAIKISTLIYAIIMGWDSLIKLLKESLIKDGCTETDIKEVLNFVDDPFLVKLLVKRLNQQMSNIGLIEELTENIEKHDKLNPRLFNKDNRLKTKIREKILEIVEEFKSELAEDSIALTIKDIVLIGSNASYNYTKDSDLDIHILADTTDLHCPDNLYPTLYSAYRNLFKKHFNIYFYGIPVELYVETEETPKISNGIYSVLNDNWIKEPVAEDIPEIDQDTFNKEFSTWEAKCNSLIKKTKKQASISSKEIEDLITEIYNLRKKGLETGGEYSIKNLIFKELRNIGILDNLKELKNQIRAKELSLEEVLAKKKKIEPRKGRICFKF